MILSQTGIRGQKLLSIFLRGIKIIYEPDVFKFPVHRNVLGDPNAQRAYLKEV